MEIRSFTPDIEVRSTVKGRTVCGIAVPWDLEQEISPYLVEGWRRGAFDHQLNAFHRIKLGREHILKDGTGLIGRGLTAKNDAKGLYVELLAANTELADETLALIEAGALEDLSVGFNGAQHTTAPSLAYQGRSTQWRTKADLVEVAVTMQGAFKQNAQILALRSQEDQDEIARVLARLPVAPPLPKL